MVTAKLFTNGRSQAVRLPRKCRMPGKDVYVRKLGSIVILIPKTDPWASFVKSLDHFSDDFLEDRNQPPSQSREPI